MRTHSIVVVAALAAFGCAGKLEQVVRSQAARDLHCPESQVDVYDQRSDNYVRDFTVSGCGQTAHYQAACSMVDSCVAYQPQQLGKDAAASEALTAGIDGVPPSESVEEVAVAPDGTVTVTPPATPATPPAKTVLEVAEAAEAAGAAAPLVTVTLRNTCSETVALFIGGEPKGGVGRMMTLASTNMTSLRVKPGEQLWLLDRERNGTTGVTIDASMREVDVACEGLSAR